MSDALFSTNNCRFREFLNIAENRQVSVFVIQPITLGELQRTDVIEISLDDHWRSTELQYSVFK